MTFAHQIRIKSIPIAQAAAMSGGFLLLLSEIRFEHREVLLDDWRPWIPIYFSVAMALFIPFATFYNRYNLRKMLMFTYVLSLFLGMLGVIFHSDGHAIERIRDLFTVWTSSVQSGAAVAGHYPPVLAPLSFAGLGSIGLLMMGIEKSPQVIFEDETG